ncbi:MAG: RIP metalloprotease RseP [Candidatus Buchananbacteria bacterium RIFCSPHIGHO2_01_FULL_39_8]|uniref:Zinc metalloprotease n=1 Tax=Candidatus Buchananbacteria bacterium RIFCSPHIGHO2_01_FULL_39_8 TaxID=1797533 RepID=A0A1G1XVX4_9BACT|nr:hypothetical protein [uncultured bacterium]OGY44235.1 MAG: RIP metalloprotease RseP [Candidatus Buchananbacteria bacterium RIFCSPHIGHO2_01_FULL_39_8]
MILTLIAFFAVLGLLVLVHELGHFVVTRRAGVKVEEFGFGLPPRIFGFYKNEAGQWRPVGLKTKEAPNTIWSLNWIPLGGFVKIKGEQGEAAADPDSFVNKSVGRRIWIISAGVFMNLVLAVFLLTIGLTAGSPQFLYDQQLPGSARIRAAQLMVLDVLADSPANQADIKAGDVILSINNKSVSDVKEFQDYLDQQEEGSVVLSIKRQNEILTKEITPEFLEETGDSGLGIALVKTAIVSYPWYIAWWYALGETLKMVWGVIVGFYIIIKNLIFSRQLVAEVYGPVGIASLVGDAARLGFLYLLQFTAILSVIIAVINFLPFPALDGGRVLFLLIEAIRGKAVNQKVENIIHNIGFALLMILVLVVTFRDIARVSSGFMNWWSGLF